MNEHPFYDAVVIGGGPGGSCAAGFLAKRGYKVAVFERYTLPRYRIGESLLPATTMGVLKKLGVQELIERQGFPKKFGGTFRWGKNNEPWTFFFYKTGEKDLKRENNPEALYSFQVERMKFDHLLFQHAQSLGAETHQETTLISIENLDQDVKTLTLKNFKGELFSVKTRYVVDASGRDSVLNKHVGQRHYDPFFRNVAVWTYFDGAGRFPGDRKGNIFCEAFPHGWFWFIPLSDTLTSVGVVLDRNAYDARKGTKDADLFQEMAAQAPGVHKLLETAVRSKTAPYDVFRQCIDYSYIHSQFQKNGLFLVGDSACFIDPVFSSGVHLATYSGFLAAEAIHAVETKKQTVAQAGAEFEDLYRKEYMVFHRFLNSFYQLHQDEDSYFWQARKVLGQQTGTDKDAFIRIVSGSATGGDVLFDSPASYVSNIAKGKDSLDLMVRRVADGDPAVTDTAFAEALDFIKPSKGSGHRLAVEAEEALKKK